MILDKWFDLCDYRVLGAGFTFCLVVGIFYAATPLFLRVGPFRLCRTNRTFPISINLCFIHSFVLLYSYIYRLVPIVAVGDGKWEQDAKGEMG